jgi:hypothetical protein
MWTVVQDEVCTGTTPSIYTQSQKYRTVNRNPVSVQPYKCSNDRDTFNQLINGIM